MRVPVGVPQAWRVASRSGIAQVQRSLAPANRSDGSNIVGRADFRWFVVWKHGVSPVPVPGSQPVARGTDGPARFSEQFERIDATGWQNAL